MKKSDIEHIQRSRFLESSRHVRSQVDNIVNSINSKYPELADRIEIHHNMSGNHRSTTLGYISSLMNLSNNLIKQNLLA
jgi:hypothetical protein